MFALLGWVICGWIAGSIAEYVLPPIEPRAGWKTIALGMAGSVVGGIVYSLLNGTRYSPSGIVFSAVGAIVALAAWRWYQTQGG
jgi:uncharacterized membrane protein YeaQ/YmgE (transglycosylase-associated protein family)